MSATLHTLPDRAERAVRVRARELIAAQASGDQAEIARARKAYDAARAQLALRNTTASRRARGEA